MNTIFSDSIKIQTRYKVFVFSEKYRHKPIGTCESSFMLISIKKELDRQLKKNMSRILEAFSKTTSTKRFSIEVILSCYPDISQERIYSLKLKTKVNDMYYEMEFPNEDNQTPFGLFKESEYLDYINNILNNLKNNRVTFLLHDYSFIIRKKFNQYYNLKNKILRIFNQQKNEYDEFVFSVDNYLNSVKNKSSFFSIEFSFKDSLIFNRIVVLPKGKYYMYSDYISINNKDSLLIYDYSKYKKTIIELLVKAEILDSICLGMDIDEHSLEQMIEISNVIKY